MLEWIPFISSYPLWFRFFFVFWLFVLVCMLLIFFPRQKEADQGKKKDSATYINQNFGIQHNNQITAEKVTIYQGSSPTAPAQPMKWQIRALLKTINPLIVQLIDNGAASQAVMINQANIGELLRLAKDPAFVKYIEIKSTGSTSSGAHNKVGGHMNDANDVGFLTGYNLLFKPALKGESEE